MTFISLYSKVDKAKNEVLLNKMRRDLLKKLCEGNLNGTYRIYENYTRLFGMIGFYDDLLKRVMSRDRSMWAETELDVATEHVCSNVAHSLVKCINERYMRHDYRNKNKNNRIFICTPSGELHNLACNIIESVLLTRGYKVYNASPSLPADSIIGTLKTLILI